MKRFLRLHGLFIRLLAVQSAFAMGIALIFFVAYAFERNRAVSSAFAEGWSESIRSAILAPASAVKLKQSVLVQLGAPRDDWHSAPQYLPRFSALKETLAKNGINVTDMMIQFNDNSSRIWMRVDSMDGVSKWVGIDGPFWNHAEGVGVIKMIAFAIMLVIGASWMPAIYMRRMLMNLRSRIDGRNDAERFLSEDKGVPEILEIHQAHDRLMARIRSQKSERSLLLAGISHDLRSPLCRIRLAADLLPATAENSAGRSRIIDNVRLADQLIETFMDLIRSTELPMDEEVDVSECARRVAQAAMSTGSELKVIVFGDVRLHGANQHLIERAISNLLDNALRHGAAPVTLRVKQAQEAVEIAVHDCGPGIDPSVCASMLQPFSRGDESRSKPGSGLGLTIVKEVADRMNGRVDFLGRSGDWTVKVTLPRRPRILNPRGGEVSL